MKMLIGTLYLVGSLIYGNDLEASKQFLRDYKYDKYSQWGEDGIIQKIFECIGTTSKVCVEFGAWDGLKYANTAHLWRNLGWKAILIEADKNKYEDLLKNIAGYACIPVHAFVGTESHDSIDAILRNLRITEPIDLMSIDIDGDDYHIFDSIQKYRPRVIICEHNPTIPAEFDIYQEKGDYFGCSVGALIRVGESKGYKLVAATETNSFFVDKKYINKFNNFELDPAKITINNYVKYIVYSYAGMPLIMSRMPDWTFAFEAHYNGYPHTLHHKHGIMRIKEWQLGSYEAHGKILR